MYSLTRVLIVALLPTCSVASGSGSRTKVKLLAAYHARVSAFDDFTRPLPRTSCTRV